MATLTGYAIKISWLGADHTYVRSSDGFIWGCWGRSAGGRAICSGTGSSKQANCIAGPDGHAGIIYGVTGVCHQTANRILSPAGVVVSGASGYWASQALYGTFGTDMAAWLVRKTACSVYAGDGKALMKAPAKPPKQVPAGTPGADSPDAQFARKVLEYYSQPPVAHRALGLADKAAPAQDIAAEFGMALDYRLPRLREAAALTQVKSVQAEALDAKHKADDAFFAGSINGEEHARRVNAVASRMLGAANKQLGGETFTQLFGMPYSEDFLLVNPKISAKQVK